MRLQLTQLRREPRERATAESAAATAAALHVRAQLVVFLDETGEFALDLVKEGVDLLLVVPPLADRGLLERDVVDVGRGQRHRNSLGSVAGRVAPSPLGDEPTRSGAVPRRSSARSGQSAAPGR